MTPLEDARATISAMSATLAKYRERYGPLDAEPDERFRTAEGDDWDRYAHLVDRPARREEPAQPGWLARLFGWRMG